MVSRVVSSVRRCATEQGWEHERDTRRIFNEEHAVCGNFRIAVVANRKSDHAPESGTKMQDTAFTSSTLG